MIVESTIKHRTIAKEEVMVAVMRNNDLYLTVPMGYQLVNGRFKVTDGAVTSNQPTDVKAGSVLTCGADGKLTFRVGRKGSSSVANWFNRQIDATTNTTFGHPADELNFAFSGRLELKLSKNNQLVDYYFDNVVIAQGSSGLANNWWFGGKTAKYIQSDRAVLEGYDNKRQRIALTCHRGGNSVNKVDILQVLTQSAWMSQLNQALYLDQINMAGTHDTGTYYAGGIEKDYAKTQSLTIAEQLRAGIRYLDVRCHHISDMFTIHHGSFYMNLYFRDLLEECRSFLANNPTETLIMQVKEEHSDADKETNTRSFYETLKVYMDQSPDIWYLEDTIPTLAQAKGKIVLVRRFDLSGSTAPKKLGIYADFTDNATFTTGHLRVQDEYKYSSVNNKWQAFSKLMAEAANKDKNTRLWFINFTSAAGTPIVDPTPESITKEMNNKLISAIAKYSFVGTVVMDFPEIPAIMMTIDKIIDKNFINPVFP